MAKSHKKKKAAPQPKVEKKSFDFSQSVQNWILIGVLILILVILLKPLVIDGLSAQGVDVVGSLGKTHQISEYNKQASDRALWNPSLFAGMPVYHRISARTFSLDSLLQIFGRWFSTVFMYYLLGAIGFFVLMRYLKMPPLLCFIGALLFVLMPHYKSLYLEGHMSKLMALMYLPWIFLSFRYFLDKRSLLSAALFALSFGLQIRTQHYQIVFYSAMMVFALGVYPFIKDLIDRKFLLFTKSTGLLISALILALALAAQPLFLAKEYLPYSKRGKTTVEVNKGETSASVQKKKSDGVSMQYATQWSTAPSEMLTWVVPRFYGGMSGEKYQGSAYPQLKGRTIPGYWGQMPFTQSYEYMGVIMLLLALWGVLAFRKDKMILSMLLFAVFLIALSLGRHFSLFYGLFYNYMPYFNKFRTPMMSVTVTYFIFVIFAIYGFKYLLNISKQEKSWKEQKTILYTLIGFFVFGLLIWLYGQSAAFVKASGEPYQGQTLEMIKNIRIEFFNADVARYFIIVLLTSALLFAFLKKKVSFGITVLILGILSVADLAQVQNRSQKEFTDVKRIECQYFKQTPTDNFLSNDTEIHRIFPTGKLFGDNRWAYRHQTIGGYSPIKMFTIEELVEKNIYKGWDSGLPINWNVLKILNVKYVIARGQVKNKHLEQVYVDQAGQTVTYLFKERLPRSFFVQDFKVIPDELKRLQFINSPNFNPAQTAILEENPAVNINAPDSVFTKLTSFSPNRLSFDVYTDKSALLVLSEVYYPPGWKIFVDEKLVEQVYKTDHAVQSIVVPAGVHKVEMKFEPESYFRNIKIASVSAGILYLIILASLLQGYLKRRK